MSHIIEAVQGSATWHKHRATHFNASDAPAMMGIGLHKTRGQLLHEKKTGIVPEVDEAAQRRFNKGHEFEAIARPWAEDMIGSELYPIVLANDVDGLLLSASLDGLTIDDETAFEHKTGSAKLIKALEAGEIPDTYHPQMEQQLMLSGATRCLFMVSSGAREGMRYAWYESDAALRERLVAGWKQFDKDLDTYEPPAAEKPVTGSAPSALPALRIELSGAVTDSNLGEFRDHAIAVFDGISTDLQTDEDFASAEETVKWCAGVEKKLAAAKDHALSQTADIDYLFRTIDEIKELARKKRLELDKFVKSMKEQRKDEIHSTAEHDYEVHIGAIEKDLERGASWPIRFPAPDPMIGPSMKGKRTIATLRDAAETAVANSKIEADRIARSIRASLDVLKAEAEGYESLFPDGGQLAVIKSADDIRNLTKARISEHQDQERQRAEREAEQKRIREERQAQTDRQRAEQQAEREQQQAGADARRQQHEAEESERRSRGKCDGNHGGGACGDSECWNIEPASVPKPAEQNRQSPVAPSRANRPGDGAIIACIARSFNVDETTARDWIAGMDMIGADA